ncbi:ATP-binding protein [Brevibacillus dissolubilis]|uniref:ATP-binding protein n=1 Tax=Brevibacillus dissolubilis TaxID=1844116 RepID=UPI001117262D|nr:sensor histidine kinase [Brevibacillus dissolubilis]
MRFQSRLMLIICSMLLFVILFIGATFEYMVSHTLHDEIGNRALQVAKTVAVMPDIIQAFDDPEPWRIIEPIAEKVRMETQAEFVVVGNRDGIRYSHPNPDRIGEKMQGGDIKPVLEGHSIIYEAVGTLGPSLRGRTPIYDESGQVIGVVSVGFLSQDIQSVIASYRYRIIAVGCLTLLLGVLGTLFITRKVKKAILGLEPEQIGQLYEEKQTILESVREGILAINKEGRITMANQTVIEMLGLPTDQNVTGLHVSDFLGSVRLLDVLKTGQAEFDQEVIYSGNHLIVNRVPIFDRNRHIIGAVSSLRYKSELYRVLEELSHVKEYAEALRAQTHEYSNKLYLISGLIQLESYQEAIEFITRESDVHLNHTRFIMREIPDPLIGGLFIGKLNRANELKVELTLDQESSFRDIPASIDRDALITIIGNLIDNAMEAVLAPGAVAKHVHVFVTDIGEDLIIEVEDSGCGIPDEYADKLFEVGFSTKTAPNHGFGLSLIRHAVEQLQGYITYGPNPGGGTIFTVAIPKNPDKTNRLAGDPT